MELFDEPRALLPGMTPAPRLTDEQRTEEKIEKRLRRRHKKEAARAASSSAAVGAIDIADTNSSASDRDEHEKEDAVKLE